MLRVLLGLWHEQLFHQHLGCTCVMPLEHAVLQGLIVRDSQRDRIPFREVKEEFSYVNTYTCLAGLPWYKRTFSLPCLLPHR